MPYKQKELKQLGMFYVLSFSLFLYRSVLFVDRKCELLSTYV